MKLLVIGSIGLDTVQTPFGKREKALGGSAVYAAIAASYFCETGIVGVVGEDFPNDHLKLFSKHQIDTSGLQFRPGKTFFWEGAYDDLNIAQTLDTQLNVFADFNPEIPEKYQDVDYLFLGNIHPELQLKVLQQVRSPKLVACDTMNFWINGEKEKLTEVIKKVDVLFINEEEIKMLTEENQVFIASEKVKNLGPKCVVVKQGAYGAFLLNDSGVFFAPVFPLKEVIDPTGAGDCFAGGFMGFLASQEKWDDISFRQAMIFGTVMAAYDVQAFSIDSIARIDRKMIDERKDQIKESVRF